MLLRLSMSCSPLGIVRRSLLQIALSRIRRWLTVMHLPIQWRRDSKIHITQKYLGKVLRFTYFFGNFECDNFLFCKFLVFGTLL